MAESDTILQLGIEAAREGNREEARNLFGLLTRQEPDNVQAWLWLAGVAESPDERRAALERVLELDPTNEMASKGLQAIGVLPGVRPHEQIASLGDATLPTEPVRSMTEEERYAAELDSAFDDYDALPKATAPPRAEPELAADETATIAGERPGFMGRGTARERSAARRASRTTPLRDDEEDEDLAPAISGPGRLLWILLGVIGALVVLFLIFQLLTRGGGEPPQIAANATATAAAASVISPTIEPIVTPAPGGGITETTTLTETTAPTDTGTLTGTTTAPTAPPATDLAAANPAPVPIGTQLQVNNWTYTYPDPNYAAVLGPQIGGFTAQGQYVVVLVWVANNPGTDQPLPANFFVLKDAQNRIYEPLPQVSSAYVIRGQNADLGMEDAVPANGVLTSIPLVFDVQRGATNLTLFARDKTDQGWPVLGSVP